MAVRGEEVADSIDLVVKGAIEKMVGEIRSTIDDISGGIEQQLKAAMQSIQADVKSASFLPQIQQAIAELEESIAAQQPPPATAVAADASRLKAAIQAVERGKSQVDILNGLLEQCLEFGSRAALLILRGEIFSGWKGVGFSAHGGNDEAVKRFNAAPGLVPELDEVLRDEHVVIWDGGSISTRLGVTASTRAVLVPMVIKDKVSAAVYVDVPGDDSARLDPTSIQLLVFTTGLLVDTLAIRKKSPSPSLAQPGDTAPAGGAQVTPRAPSIPPAVATPRTATPPAATSRPMTVPATPPRVAESAEATVAINAAQVRDMMAPPPSSASLGGDFGSATRLAPPPPPPPPPSTSEERPTTQYVPPAGIGGARGIGGAQTEDGQKHDEARRFARLLVSEIKLYNEPKVEQGRKNRDLYERLKDDIDRSRQMYDDRIGEDVRKTSNYFYDELVRTLADGNAEVLGL